MNENKPPPFDEGAEIAVLGSMILHNDCIGKVKGELEAGDFYTNANREIFRAILDLAKAGTAVDGVTLRAELERRKLWEEIGGFTYFPRVVESYPSAANIMSHIALVRDASRQRNMLRLAQDIRKGVIDGVDGERLAALAKELQSVSVGDGAGGIDLVCLADVEPEPLQWLWPGRVPLGKLTLLVGDPGLGKSCVTLDIAARVSRGRPWPDAPGTPGRRGSVVVLSAEDDVADTILPRLLAAGGNVERVHALQSVRQRTGKGQAGNRMFDLARDLPYMEDVLQKVGDVLMVVIDPLSAYMPSADSHVNAEVRGVLGPLAALASKHRVAVVAVSHLNKGAGTPAAYRVTGSIAFTAAARAVWCTAKDKDNPSRRLFLPMKCNLAPDQSGLAFALAKTPDHPGIPTVAWERDAVTMNLDDALAVPKGPERGDSASAEVEEWLKNVLGGGEVSVMEVRNSARNEGHSWHAVKRAKVKIGVKTFRRGFGSDSVCYWTLHTEQDPSHSAQYEGAVCEDPGEREAIVAEGGGDE